MTAIRLALLLVCFCLSLPLRCGAQVTTGWSLVWADEFNQADGSSPDPTKWTYDTGAGGWGNSELENYTSRTNNVRIEGGQLVIEARQESYQGSSYTSARLKTQGKFSWTYGRMEARIKIPRGQGMWPAFWALGTNINSVNWPTCGEIDIMENIGKEPALVHGTGHGPGYSGANGIGGPYSLPGPGAFADDYHNYAIEWTTNSIKWFVDNQQYFMINPARLPGGTNWVFTAPQFILLNLAVGGGWPGNPDGTTVFPQRMTVDYVRVYAPTNLTACNNNLLTNPGFETGTFAGWSTNGNDTYVETIANYGANIPVHSGTNVFKVFGQFNGVTNSSSANQNISAAPGQIFTADGWGCTTGTDPIAGANSAWLQVTFYNALGTSLSAYRSSLITTNSQTNVWLNLSVTNQINPATMALIGTVTSYLRYSAVFLQPANAAGSVDFDDLRLTSGGTTETPVATSSMRQGSSLKLGFPTYLNLPYQVDWRTSLANTVWQPFTNFPGTGTTQSVTLNFQSPAAFYRVARLCN
jgi:beta-glucanase (GH16 family)